MSIFMCVEKLGKQFSPPHRTKELKLTSRVWKTVHLPRESVGSVCGERSVEKIY